MEVIIKISHTLYDLDRQEHTHTHVNFLVLSNLLVEAVISLVGLFFLLVVSKICNVPLTDSNNPKLN